MAQSAQQQHQYQDLPVELSQPWPRTPLTSSSLQQLGNNDEQDRSSHHVSPIMSMSRRTSVDSDRFSTVSGLTYYFPNNPTNANPAAAYVAPFGASQVVSEHLSSQFQLSEDEGDEKLNKDDVQFSEAALALVNAFLDQLVYSVLMTARSTHLSALRPAVTEVLKHRLAREAITSAEEELAELLAGGDDEEEDAKHKSAEAKRQWDLELVWKRTRLRVMVYMRLGELEDEDEQRYVREEELFHGSERRFSQSSGLVSWAAAIFLTSVLEYVAEQTLQVAGQAAYTRARRQSRTRRLTSSQETHKSETLTVEEYDVEKVALSSTLGRIWRTWRKALRSNAPSVTPTQRSSRSVGRASRDNMVSAMSHRRSSFDTANEGSMADGSRPMSRDLKDEVPDAEYSEQVLAANISLPMGHATRDIDEIEVPGLATYLDGEHDDRTPLGEQHPEYVLGSFVPLPMGDAKRDIDEIEVPGLSGGPDAVGGADGSRTPTNAGRRYSLGEVERYSVLPTPGNAMPGSWPTQSARPGMTRLRSSSTPNGNRTSMSTGKETLNNSGYVSGARESQIDEQAFMTAQLDQRTSEAPGGDGTDNERASGFPWMVGGAAGAATVAVAAGVWTSGSDEHMGKRLPDDANQRNALLVHHASSASQKGFGGLINSASQNDGRKEEQTERPGVVGARRQPSWRSHEEIEELDRRKSLIDMKAMMAADHDGSSSAEGQLSPPAVNGGSENGGPYNAIGVASTADVASTMGSESTQTQARDFGQEQATGGTKRPPQLYLGDETAARRADSPTIKPAPSPRTRAYYDLTSETPQQAEEQRMRSQARPAQRGNLTNGAQELPSGEQPAYRQPPTAAVDRNGATSKPGFSRPLKPVIDTASMQTLTSASIRGPEDFE
ncbi:hypothetical protein LTR37_019876, partial [Vermiconidia calcicola]